MQIFAPPSYPALVWCRWYPRNSWVANCHLIFVSGQKKTTFCPPRVPLPQRDAPSPQASPKLEATAATAAPVLFTHKLALLKRELDIAPAIPAIPAVAEASQHMGITPGLDQSLGSQLDRLLAIISS